MANLTQILKATDILKQSYGSQIKIGSASGNSGPRAASDLLVQNYSKERNSGIYTGQPSYSGLDMYKNDLISSPVNSHLQK